MARSGRKTFSGHTQSFNIIACRKSSPSLPSTLIRWRDLSLALVPGASRKPSIHPGTPSVTRLQPTANTLLRLLRRHQSFGHSECRGQLSTKLCILETIRESLAPCSLLCASVRHTQGVTLKAPRTQSTRFTVALRHCRIIVPPSHHH